VLRLDVLELPPRGSAAAAHDQIVGMVKIWPFVSRPTWRAASAEECADLAVDALRRRGRLGMVDPDRVHLHLMWFGGWDPTLPAEKAGVAPVFFHPDDSLRGAAREALPNDYFRTPWYNAGIAVGQEWMRAFAARYRQRQGQIPNIPSPETVTFDTESLVFPEDFPTLCKLFDALRADPRWNDPAWPVNSAGQTLAQAYEAAGSPAYSPERGPTFMGQVSGQPVNNIEFSIWYRNLTFSARAYALDRVVRVPLTSVFPGVRYGDVCSRTFDGVHDTQRPPFGFRLPRGQSWDWWRMQTTGYADYDVIYLYDVWSVRPEPGQSPWDRSVRVNRDTLEAMLFSSAPGRPGPRWGAMMPWVQFPGQDSGADTHAPNPAEVSRMLRTLVHLGVTRAMVFVEERNDRPEGWDGLVEALDGATSSWVRSATLAGGRELDPALLRRADWQLAEIPASETGRVTLEATLATTHREPLVTGSHMIVTAELRQTNPPMKGVRLEAQNPATGAWVELGDLPAEVLRAPNRVLGEWRRPWAEALPLIADDGTLRVRLTILGGSPDRPAAVDLLSAMREP
jgi:hypothetical protein